MVFKHLENRLAKGKDNNISHYLEVFENLREPTKTVLGYTLDIASYLNEEKLGDDYTIFGGYAVLSHLMQDFGEDIARFWRGSDDIDMAGTPKALKVIRGGYKIHSDRPSPNLSNKRTLKLVQDEEAVCKIDFYDIDAIDGVYTPEMHKHFGIPLKVADPLSLIRGKLRAPSLEVIHATDIMRMLAILEKRCYSHEQIVRYFTADQKADLMKRIKLARRIETGKIEVLPDQSFVKSLEKLLHKSMPPAD